MPSYYTLALGCQANKLDAEKIDAVLQRLNFTSTDKEEKADLVNVVACAVRQSAVDRIHGRIERWDAMKKERPLVTVLTGCVLPHDREHLGKKFDILLDPREIGCLPEKLREKMGEIEDIFPESDYFKVPTTHKSSFQAFVTIMTGCNKFCTYCAVPYTRGREVCRPANQIIEEVQDLISRGYQEVTLLGQTVNSYQNTDGKNSIKTFSDLLRALCKIEGNFWIRFISPYPTDFTDELIDVIRKEPKICKHLHLPVQAGSNAVLKRMLRKYTREQYLGLVRKIRANIPQAAITTDVIVGFCGETEEDFKQTLDLFREVEYDMAYTAQYSVRPGTQAQKRFQDDVPKEEKKRREKILNDVLAETASKNNQKLVGKTVPVLVEKEENGILSGKTDTYKSIRIHGGSQELVGTFVFPRITQAKTWGLEGVLG